VNATGKHEQAQTLNQAAKSLRKRSSALQQLNENTPRQQFQLDTQALADEVAKANQDAKIMTNVVLLTDGQHYDRTNEKDSIVPMLRETLATFGRLDAGAPVIHTFGFGYDIDADLLHGIANAGHGAFSCARSPWAFVQRCSSVFANVASVSGLALAGVVVGLAADVLGV
jgi:hypothetical protein